MLKEWQAELARVVEEYNTTSAELDVLRAAEKRAHSYARGLKWRSPKGIAAIAAAEEAFELVRQRNQAAHARVMELHRLISDYQMKRVFGGALGIGGDLE